jgi:hypothetical protein
VECCDWVYVAGGKITLVQSYYDSRNLPHFKEY